MTYAKTLLAAALALVGFTPSAAFADTVPPAGTAYVDSLTRPIRVYYDTGFLPADAQAVVKMAEASWNVQITQMGFSAPWRLIDGKVESGLSLWVTTLAGGNAASYEATADVPSTPQTDCAMVEKVGLPLYAQSKPYFEFAVDHAFNHVSLLGVDCIEPYWALEMYAGAVAQCEGRADIMGMDVFQKYPEYAIDYQPASMDDMYYRYGASLFPLFFEERFGARDGTVLAEIWKHTPQNGTMTGVGEMPSADVDNIPTYLNAFDTFAKSKGSSFDQAYAEFAVWRTLTGANWTDGKHFQDANSYPEITWTASYAVADLPVKTVHPAKKVSAYGSSHVLFDMTGVAAGKAVKLTVAGTAPYNWAANAVCMRAGAGAEVVPLAVDAKTRAGSAVVPNASRCRAIALVVANLSDGKYDGNYPNTSNDGDYTYGALFLDMPTIASINPASLAQGLHGQAVYVKGTSFGTSGSDKLAASFSGTGVTVESVTWSDTITIVLTVSVDDDAPLGARDLSLTTGQGLPASMPAALLITEKPVPPDAGAEQADASTAEPESDASVALAPDGGTSTHGASHGGCNQAGAGLPLSLVAGLAVLFAALRRRAR